MADITLYYIYNIVNKTLTSLLKLLVIMIITFFVFDWIDSDPPVDLNYRIRNPNVVAGGELIIDWSIVRKKTCRSVRSSYLIDADKKRTTFDNIETFNPGKIGVENSYEALDIPDKIAVGPAVYHRTVSWQCPYNLYQKWINPTSITYEIPFNVLPSPTTHTPAK